MEGLTGVQNKKKYITSLNTSIKSEVLQLLCIRHELFNKMLCLNISGTGLYFFFFFLLFFVFFVFFCCCCFKLFYDKVLPGNFKLSFQLLRFKQAHPNICHSPKVEDGVEIYFVLLLGPIILGDYFEQL